MSVKVVSTQFYPLPVLHSPHYFVVFFSHKLSFPEPWSLLSVSLLNSLQQTLFCPLCYLFFLCILHYHILFFAGGSRYTLPSLWASKEAEKWQSDPAAQPHLHYLFSWMDKTQNNQVNEALVWPSVPVGSYCCIKLPSEKCLEISV